MTLLLTMLTTVGAWATSVSYIDENGQQQSHDCDGFPQNASSLSTGWYVVSGEILNRSYRLVINGDVKLILVDGCQFWYPYGIEVSGGNSLTIYGQSNNSGKLWVLTHNDNGHQTKLSNSNAAIGCTNNGSCGTIKIHGGIISVNGGNYSYIYGGSEHYREGSCAIGGNGGSITITGGKVSATGGLERAAIGSGSNVTITGGEVSATGGGTREGRSYSGDGIGGDLEFGVGTITITGGKVSASAGGNSSHGICGGTIKISGGEINAGGIGGSGTTTELSWTRTTDYINCWNAYNGTVKLNKQFYADGTLFNTGTVSDLTTINGKKLIPYVLEGSGTQSAPYIISSTENWTTFCQMLSSGDKGIFTGKYVKLTNDITVTTMAGSSQHDFTGIFDGGENTLTFNYGKSGTPTSDQYVAPFRFVTNTDDTPATIKNLHVKGDIYTKAKYAAGIVAQHWGTLNIENCRSSIVIHSSITGNDLDGTHGGFEAVSNGVLNIKGCVFDGKLLTTESNTNCAGFVGWRAVKEKHTFTNCLYAPADDANTVSTGCYTFMRNPDTYITTTNSYYTAALGTAQGLQAYSISGATGVTVEPAGSSTEYNVSGITAYSKGLKYNNVFYAGASEQVSLTLSTSNAAGRVVKYTTSGGSLSGSDNPYTLTLPAANVTISPEFHASPLLGYTSTYDPDGSDQKPYIINSAEGWNFFCDAIENNSAWNHFSGKTVRLNAPITVTKMAGSSSHPFCGIFDGYNKTLTFNNKTASEALCAPFRYVNGATIKRLTVAGEVINSGKQTGGLIAHAKGSNTIDHCVVNASLTSNYSGDASNGGFIAHIDNGTTDISDCVFKGSLLGSSATHSGGFVGWVSGTQVNFTNCIFAPAQLTMVTSNSCTFNRNNKNTFNNCYYTTAFGTKQGTMQVSATAPESIAKKVSGADGASYYIEGTTTVSGVNSTYDYTGSVIAITPTVTFAGTTLTSNDYTVSTTPATVKEAGEYTLTITGKNSYAGTKSMTFKVLSVLTTDASGAYVIRSANDWDVFCDYVNNRGENFSEKTVKLAENIVVSEMAGINYNKRFCGTFDGGGFTLTFNKTVTSSGCAPFAYVDGATFKNLTVDGTISSTATSGYAAGIAVYNYGNTKIEDCVSNITINFSGTWGDNAGFVCQNASNATLSFERCTFSGSMTGNTSSSTECSGFVEYNSNSGSDVTISYTDCLFDPTSIEVGSNYCATFNRNGHNAFTRTYYTKAWGEAQGAAAYVTAPDAGVFKQITVGGKNFFTAAEITTDLIDMYGYQGTALVITPTVTFDGQTVAPEKYTVVVKDADNNDVTAGIEATGSYTLTVTFDGTQLTGSKSFSFKVCNYLAGEGSAESPYLIGNAADWAAFAANIGMGMNLSAHYKLTGSFETGIMIGDYSRKFSGHLDGNNQTLTFNKTASDDLCAPFRYVDGATIEKLTVAGTVSNSGKRTAGLIAYATGDNTIDHCFVTASLTSSYNGDASNGGFIAHIENGTTNISDCAFKGRLLGGSANCSAGFVGYISNKKVNFTNCLFAPVEVTMSANNSCTFNRNGYNAFTNCYYTTAFGTAQGNMASATIPENRLYKPVTAVDGVTYYQPLDVTNMYSTYAYNDGNAITVEPVVKLGNDVVAADGYTVTIKDNNQQEVLPENLKAKGSYTLTISGNGTTYYGSQDLAFNIVTGTSLDGYVFTTEGEGENIVYLINDESDLERLAAYVNSGHNATGMTFKLNDNIDMKGEHTAIGKNYSNRFYGTFDGNNNTIKDLTINKENDDYQGLFGAIGEAAVIKDVTLQDCNITGKEDVGGFVGLASGDSKARATIQNCHVKNGKIFGTVGGADNHGGIAGYTYGTNVTDCTVSGEVTSTAGNQHYGGIVGKAYYYITVTNCENSASISSTYQRIGGIVGYVNGGDNRYENCLNTGSVSGKNYVGSIVGDGASSTTFDKCYYTNNTKPVNGNDRNGTARVFTITGDARIASIATAEDVTVVSKAGTKYYTAGDWTLTLTLQEGLNLVALNCEGGTLSDPASLTKNKLTISNADVTLSTIASQSTAVDLANVDIADIPSQRWMGNMAHEPALNVTYQGTPLTQGTDYMATYTDNTAAGTATVTLTGINTYKGTATKTFSIADFSLKTPGEANSAENPYQIGSEEDLEALASIVNSGSRTGGYYQQTANIPMTKEHTAIGTKDKPFTGSYNGKNGDTQYTISGLTINKPNEEYQGLFGYFNNQYATVQNVIVTGCNIIGKKYVGGIFGKFEFGTVKNCFVTGHLEAETYVGAVIGYRNWGTHEHNYYSACNVKGWGSYDNAIGWDSSNRVEPVSKITAGAGVSITYPATPTYGWDDEKYYKPDVVVTLSYDVPTGKVFDHYSVSNGEISNPGIEDGQHTLTGFTQDVVISGVYADNLRSLEDGNGLVADMAELTFTNRTQHPLPVVTYNGELLEKDVNYTLSYSNGCCYVGNYTVTVKGVGRYTGTLTKQFAIAPLDISTDGAINVYGIYATYGQTGSVQHPEPTKVISPAASNSYLTSNDYTLDYSDGCTTPGNYQVTLTGKGNYTGSKVINFTILEAYSLTVNNTKNYIYYVPLHGYYCNQYQKNEFVTPAADLANMDGKLITSMQFYLYSKASKVWDGTFQVFLKEVDATTTSAFSGTDGATIVYEGSLDGTQDLMTIDFTTPYVYKGGNLLVGIYETKTGNYASADFYCKEVSGASVNGRSSNSLASVTADKHNYVPKTTFWYETPVTLAEAGTDNSTTISENATETKDVVLAGRTLYKDGDWNTICLPFDVELEGSVLDGAIAKTLTDATMTGTTVSLTFGNPDSETQPVKTLKAGVPYIIKWTKAADYVDDAQHNIVDPVFSGVTVVSTSAADRTIEKASGHVKFIGYYDAFGIDTPANDDIYYLTTGGALRHTGKARTLMACRAYFQFSENYLKARSFMLNVDDETTGVDTSHLSALSSQLEGEWYTLDGRKLYEKPTRKGLYIFNGTKVTIK